MIAVRLDIRIQSCKGPGFLVAIRPAVRLSRVALVSFSGIQSDSPEGSWQRWIFTSIPDFLIAPAARGKSSRMALEVVLRHSQGFSRTITATLDTCALVRDEASLMCLAQSHRFHASRSKLKYSLRRRCTIHFGLDHRRFVTGVFAIVQVGGAAFRPRGWLALGFVGCGLRFRLCPLRRVSL
jgi:hypothetical protein